jgi:hypothetical protein
MNRIILSAVAIAALLAISPASATPQVSDDQSMRRADSPIVLAARGHGVVSPEARKACHHFRNAHQRHKCEQEHMHAG